MVATASPQSFVPATVDVADFSQLEPLYQSLLNRPISTRVELERWLAEFSELSAVVDEYGCRRYIDKSCHTDDASIEKAYLHFVENIEPRVKPFYFRLQKKLLETPALKQLPESKYALLARKWRADVEVFRDENIPLETEVTKLNNAYDKTCGAMMVSFRGEEYTIQQMARFGEDPDRTTRQEAWESSTNRRLADRETIDGIFDSLLPLREKIAANAGMTDYRSHVWKSWKRFDYTPDDCLKFADAIEVACVPVVRKLNAHAPPTWALSGCVPGTWKSTRIIDPRCGHSAKIRCRSSFPRRVKSFSDSRRRWHPISISSARITILISTVARGNSRAGIRSRSNRAASLLSL